MVYFFRYILIFLLSIGLFKTFVVQAFRIPTGSMKPTLLIGDFLLVSKFIYGIRTDRIYILDYEVETPLSLRMPGIKKPQNGDLLVFKYPKDESLDYINRCVAVGGQTIEIREGEVYINGEPEGEKLCLGRRYDPEEGRYVTVDRITTHCGKSYLLRHYADGYSKAENFGPVTVPEGNYFMMGDNRDNSSDSRVWGFLPAENVVGKAFILYFSWDRMGPAWKLIDRIRWSRIGVLLR